MAKKKTGKKAPGKKRPSCKKGWTPARELVSCYSKTEKCVPQLLANDDANAANIFRKIVATDPGTYLSTEIFLMIWTDNRHQVLSYSMFPGGCTYVSLDICAITRLGVLAGATNALLIHNHPGGIPDPSPQDYQFTEKLAVSFKAVDIILQDHLVVGYRLSADGRVLGDFDSIRRLRPDVFRFR